MKFKIKNNHEREGKNNFLKKRTLKENAIGKKTMMIMVGVILLFSPIFTNKLLNNFLNSNLKAQATETIATFEEARNLKVIPEWMRVNLSRDERRELFLENLIEIKGEIRFSENLIRLSIYNLKSAKNLDLSNCINLGVLRLDSLESADGLDLRKNTNLKVVYVPNLSDEEVEKIKLPPGCRVIN